MSRIGFIIWFCSFVVSVYFGALEFNKGVSLDTNFLNFFSTGSVGTESQQAQQIYEDRLLEKVVVVLSSKDRQKVIDATPMIAEKLCDDPVVSECNWSTSLEDTTKIYTYYNKYKQYILPDSAIEKLQSNKSKDLIGKRVEELFSPLGMSEVSQLTSDPFGFLSKYLKSLSSGFNFYPSDGMILANEGELTHSVITLNVKTKVPSVETKLNQLIEAARTKLIATHSGVKLSAVSGLLYLNAGSAQSMKEASLLGGLSFVLVITLILLVFKSLSPLIAAFTTIFFSSLVGFLACNFLYEKVHIAALLMGISLMGVVADYCIHYFSHNEASALSNRASTLRKIFKPFVLSLFTSVVGYAGFYFTGVLVLQQLSVFAVFGLLAAGFTVFFMYPLFKGRDRVSLGFPSNVLLGFSRFRNSLFSMTAVIEVLVYIGLIVGVTLLFKVQYDDNVRNLQKPNPELYAQELLIRKAMGASPQGQYYLVEARDHKQLLEIEEQLASYHSKDTKLNRLSNWVPSEIKQLESLEHYKNLSEVVTPLYRRLGVKNYKDKSQFVYKPSSRAPLNLENWLKQFPNHPLADQYIGKLNDNYYSVASLISGELLPESKLPKGVSIISRASDVSKMFKTLRESMTLMIMGLVLGVFLVVSLFFGYKKAMQIYIAPCMGLVWAALLSFWVVGYIDLFHVLGLVLVFFLSIDYSFFNNFGASQDNYAVDVGIGVSVLTTLLSFGVLIFSQTAAIQHFGMSVLFGIVVSYIFTVRKRDYI